jgi:hypothetical protein
MLPLPVSDRELPVRVGRLNRMDATPSRHGAVALFAVAAALFIAAAPAHATSTRAARPRLVCPPHPPASLPHHQRAGVATTMVPGHPRRLLGCRFHGSNEPEAAGTLASSKALPASEVASAFDDARVISPAGPVLHCPADFGEQIVLVFGYADGTPLRVSVEAQGCGDATNGARPCSRRPYSPVSFASPSVTTPSDQKDRRRSRTCSGRRPATSVCSARGASRVPFARVAQGSASGNTGVRCRAGGAAARDFERDAAIR